MKTLLKISVMFIMLNIVVLMTPGKSQAQGGQVSFQIFYDQLSPYGTWIDDPNYGYVWLPNADPDFYPYGTNGYWELTDCGWTWISDYPWGWAPFHYGRWNYDPNYGYGWIPDYEWGPAWVIWRRGNGYYGWVPLAPGFSIEIGFNRAFEIPDDRWMFVRDRDFGQHGINRYFVDRSYNHSIVYNSALIRRTRVDMGRHTTYVSGPPREDVERYSGRRYNPVYVRDYNKPGQEMNNNQLRMYRPVVQRGNPGGHRPAPAKVVNREEYKNKYQQQHPQRQQQQPPQKNNQPPQKQQQTQRQQQQPPQKQQQTQRQQQQPPQKQQQTQRQQQQPPQKQQQTQRQQQQPPQKQQQTQPQKQQQQPQRQQQTQPQKQQQQPQKQQQTQPQKQQQQQPQKQQQTQPQKQQQQQKPQH